MTRVIMWNFKFIKLSTYDPFNNSFKDSKFDAGQNELKRVMDNKGGDPSRESCKFSIIHSPYLVLHKNKWLMFS